MSSQDLSDKFGSIVLGRQSTPGLDATADTGKPVSKDGGPVRKMPSFKDISTRLRSLTPVNPSETQSRGRGMSLTCAAGDIVNEFKETEKGGGNWGRMVKLFDEYCQRLMGPPIEAHKDSITRNAIFKRTVLLSDWIYSADASHCCDPADLEQRRRLAHRRKKQREPKEAEEETELPDQMSDASLMAGSPPPSTIKAASDTPGGPTTVGEDASSSSSKYPLNEDLECVMCSVVGGKQIAQFALFVPKSSDETGDGLPSSSSSSPSSVTTDGGNPAYLVFKGTDPGKIFDLIADICAIPFPLASGVGLHCGMYASMKRDFDRIRSVIQSYSSRIGTLYVTGHSLGGGLAACFVLECLLQSHLDTPLALITFGAPTVVSLDLDAWFHHHPRVGIISKQQQSSSSSSDSIPTPSTVAEALKLIPSEFERVRRCIATYIRISHHIVNRLDLVPRVPSSPVWVRGTIPFCVQKLLTSMICSKFGFNSIKPVRLAMGQAVRAANAHTELYGDLLRTYWPLGHYYVFTSDGRYYYSDVPETVEKVYQFTPPVKVTLTYTLPPSNRDRRLSMQSAAELGAAAASASDSRSSMMIDTQDEGYSDDSDELVEFEDVSYKEIMEDHLDTVTGIAQEHVDKALVIAQQGLSNLRSKVTAAISGQSTADTTDPGGSSASSSSSDDIDPPIPAASASSAPPKDLSGLPADTDAAAIGDGVDYYGGDQEATALTPAADTSTQSGDTGSSSAKLLSAKHRINLKKKKARDEPRKCTVKLMMRCMDRRLQLYGNEEEKKEFIEWDERQHEKVMSELSILSSELRDEMEMNEKLAAKKRTRKLSVISGERALLSLEDAMTSISSEIDPGIKDANHNNIKTNRDLSAEVPFNTRDFVIVGGGKEKKKSGCSDISFDTQAWTTLGNCHKTGSYLKLFGLSSDYGNSSTEEASAVSYLRTTRMDERKIQSSLDVFHREKKKTGVGSSSSSADQDHHHHQQAPVPYELPKSMEEVGERVKLRAGQARTALRSGLGKFFGT